MNNALSIIFRILSAVTGLYNTLCFIRIIVTWIPQISYSKFARVLSKICDPYLNLFHKIRWLTIGSFDFSPALALCILGALSSLFTSLASPGTISVGMILSIIIQLIWSIISSLLIFFIILLIVRLIILLVNKNSYQSGSYIIEQIDRSIAPMLYNIGKTFTGGKKISYKTALIIAIVVFAVCLFAGSVLFAYLATLVSGLPF